MNFRNIVLEKDQHIATITLNRPERLNAMNEQMSGELIAALRDIDTDPEMRVMVITGAGRAFCSGADIKGGKEGEQVLEEQHGESARQQIRRSPQKVTLGIKELEIPTIAMVNGTAVGAGFDWAMACDIRIGSENARFMIGYTRLGLIPGTGATWLMPRIMGVAKAAEYLFSSRFLEAEEAFRIGLLNKLVATEKLAEETYGLARAIAQGPPIAIKLAKLHLHQGLQMELRTSLEFLAGTQAIVLTSEDYKTAVAAVRGKKAAQFRGK